MKNLSEISTIDMLKEIKLRGGHPGALAEAALLCILKSQDYNPTSEDTDPHKIDRSCYFPFGTISYAQMIHTKALRFNSLALNELAGQKPNFEGLRDTSLDIINYAGFFVSVHPVRENK